MQRPSPVDRLRDARRLLEVQLAHLLDHLHQLAGHRLVELGRMQADDLELVLELGVVEPQIQAAALERLGQLTRVVGGQQHDRLGAGLDPSQLGDRDLEVGEQLEQHRLELLVGLVDLVDQQHDRLGEAIACHQRARRAGSPRRRCPPARPASPLAYRLRAEVPAWMRSSCLR